MTPKQQFILAVGIMSALGIGVSVGIIAFGGGFSGEGPSIFNPPTDADIFVIGSNVRDGMSLEYMVTAMDPDFPLVDSRVSINFAEQDDRWKTTFNITKDTTTKEFVVLHSKQLTNDGQVSEDVRPFLQPVESSVLAIRDMDYGNRPKYLVVGAPWDTIFYGSSSTTVKIVSQQTIQTQAGSFDSYVLGYKLKDKESRIWMTKEVPFPVKAEVYDPEDKLFYSYELIRADNIR